MSVTPPKRFRRTEGKIIYKYKDFFIMRLEEFKEFLSDGSYFEYEIKRYVTADKKFECWKMKRNSSGVCIGKGPNVVKLSRKHVVGSIQSGKWKLSWRSPYRTRKENTIFFRNLSVGDKIEVSGNTHTVVKKTKYHIETNSNFFQKSYLKTLINEGKAAWVHTTTPHSTNSKKVTSLTESQLEGLSVIKDWMVELQKSETYFKYTLDRSKVKRIPLNTNEYEIEFTGCGWKNRDYTFNRFWMLLLRVIKKGGVNVQERNFLNFLRNAYLEFTKSTS